MYRYPANIVPLGSHAEVDRSLLSFAQAAEAPALTEDMRISVHPGHFTVISATGPTWRHSLDELLYQSELMDRLDVDGDITIHGGGVDGDPSGTARRIVANIATLSERVRKRLRLENDERAWSVGDLLPVREETGTSLIVDNLHHALNGGTPLDGLPWGRILATWGGANPSCATPSKTRPSALARTAPIPTRACSAASRTAWVCQTMT